MKTASTIAALSLAASLALAGTASAQTVDLNGGSSWNGWSSVGNSQTSGTWVKGSTTRTYDIYSTSFVLSADQTVGGSRIAGYSDPFTPYAAGDGVGYTGDLADSLFSGVWQAGDRIVGMGIQYTGSTRGSTFFFHRDTGGNNIAAASSFGANDGLFSHDVGDSSSYMTTSAGNPRGQVRYYAVWNGFSQNGSPQEGNFTAPYSWNANPKFGPTPFPEFPTRTFAVLDNGSMDLVKSVQYFVNYDAILRSNGGLTFGDGDFGPNTRFGFWEGHAGEFSQQIFAIPAPGAIVLDGAINPGEGWTQFLDARDIQVFIASDDTNLYFAASTPDSAVGGNLFRQLDLNFGIDGNTGPWRYRVQSRSNTSWVRGTETSQAFSGGFTNGWSGFFDGGDDSATEPGAPFHPDNWGDLGAGLVEYSVGMNAGRREHEFAIPWCVLLDGQNGWNYNSTLALRVAGFYVGTESTPFGNGFSWGAGPTGGVNFADQSTYALVNIPSNVVSAGIADIVCLGVPNSTGKAGTLRAEGSLFAADNDLTFEARCLPANQNGLLVNSSTAVTTVNNPGGSAGNLCIASFNMGRHPVTNTGAAGSVLYPIDTTSLPTNVGPSFIATAMVGDTWYFQFWHRDVAGDSNFSNAVSVTFQ